MLIKLPLNRVYCAPLEPLSPFQWSPFCKWPSSSTPNCNNAQTNIEAVMVTTMMMMNDGGRVEKRFFFFLWWRHLFWTLWNLLPAAWTERSRGGVGCGGGGQEDHRLNSDLSWKGWIKIMSSMVAKAKAKPKAGMHWTIGSPVRSKGHNLLDCR